MRVVLIAALLSLMTSPPSSRPSAHLQVDRGSSYVLTAVAEADVPARGSYELQVSRTGASGSSSTRQSGAVELHDSAPRVLSAQTVSAAAGDHIVATLTVTWDDGQISRDLLDETVGDAPAR